MLKTHIMIKSLLSLIFLFPFLAYSNPVLDRQESMRDFNKLRKYQLNKMELQAFISESKEPVVTQKQLTESSRY